MYVTFGGSSAWAHGLLLLRQVEPADHVGQGRLQQLDLVLLHLDPLLQGGDAVGHLHTAGRWRTVIWRDAESWCQTCGKMSLSFYINLQIKNVKVKEKSPFIILFYIIIIIIYYWILIAKLMFTVIEFFWHRLRTFFVFFPPQDCFLLPIRGIRRIRVWQTFQRENEKDRERPRLEYKQQQLKLTLILSYIQTLCLHVFVFEAFALCDSKNRLLL